ncbi:hypothetical protein [Ralstonia pseudosolanacearum]|uniref:hypothetical protein n=1 Tax=Ralstonia pseudosolanacearum TaxID=1310165 RepID=UPI001FF79AB1|nr:hypothetical protein [Ralstonia pseudosolanacearum]
MPSISSRIEKLEAQIAIAGSSSLADRLEAARKRHECGEQLEIEPGDRPTDSKGAELFDKLQTARARVRTYHADEPLPGHDTSMSNKRFKELTTRGTPLTPEERAEVQAEVNCRRARRGEDAP